MRGYLTIKKKKNLQSGTSIAVNTLSITASESGFHSGQSETMMENYLYYDEDTEDSSVSSEVINIMEIVTDLQVEETEQDFAALEVTSQLHTKPISHSEALACFDTLIPYLESLSCSTLQQPSSRESFNISDTVQHLQNLSSAVKAYQHLNRNQATLHSWFKPVTAAQCSGSGLADVDGEGDIPIDPLLL